MRVFKRTFMWDNSKVVWFDMDKNRKGYRGTTEHNDLEMAAMDFMENIGPDQLIHMEILRDMGVVERVYVWYRALSQHQK